jgi:hypothetical protein
MSRIPKPEARISMMTNHDIAGRFDEVAQLLEAQGANQYRVQAWRAGAETLRQLPREAGEILEGEGIEGLERLPSIGQSLARSIRELLEQGRLRMLDRLRGKVDPHDVLTTVPGIGPTLAERIYHELGVDSLEDLEAAAHDGRLQQMGGFGEKRLAGIREALATRLRTRRLAAPHPAPGPAVGELLDVDREYRERVAQGDLPKIAPRRFNPEREAWLPVLHTSRGPRHYTALYSNTARAHAAHKTHDWVVLYFDGADGERQHTVITASRGPLSGRRIIPGREVECARWYEQEVGDRESTRDEGRREDRSRAEAEQDVVARDLGKGKSGGEADAAEPRGGDRQVDVPGTSAAQRPDEVPRHERRPGDPPDEPANEVADTPLFTRPD